MFFFGFDKIWAFLRAFQEMGDTFIEIPVTNSSVNTSIGNLYGYQYLPLSLIWRFGGNTYQKPADLNLWG